jgi:hypothetical protein
MTEASGAGGGARAEMERRLIERGLEDESFRQRLLEDPRGAIEEELGTHFPEEVEVVAAWRGAAHPGVLGRLPSAAFETRFDQSPAREAARGVVRRTQASLRPGVEGGGDPVARGPQPSEDTGGLGVRERAFHP